MNIQESANRFTTEDAQLAYGLNYFARLLDHLESILGSIQTRRATEKDPAKIKGLQIQEQYFAEARQTLQSELKELREAAATAKKQIPVPTLKGPVTVPIGDVHAVSVLFGSGTHPALDGPAGEHTTGNVNVHVSTKGTPITLLLMAYEPVDWHLTIEPGTQILSVIARGYHEQKVTGLPRSVPIDSAFFQDGWQYFTTELITKDRYLDFREEVKKMLGREPVTVQSQRRGKDFAVDGNLTLSFADSGAGGQAGPIILISRKESVAKTMSQDFLSSGKLTVGYCCAGPFTESKASVAYNTGKRYVEFVLSRANGVNGMSRWTDVGLMSPGRDTYRFDTRENSNGYGVVGLLSERTQLADGDIIGLAIDLDSSRLYFRRNGNWMNGDPERGSGGMNIKPGRDYAAAVTAAAPERQGEASDRWTANFGGRPFVYQLPKDFLPYQSRN
ncbi:MAG: hypothetical protein EWM73_01127 [Nitrospira sp.]|nr:MAG: hypothetical protein EWM73_01127 [Nitrospira sp.]